MIADSDAVPNFDIDDTPVTLRTRPTRAKLVSTMLLQRSISQKVVRGVLPPPPTMLSRLLAVDNPETSAKDKITPSSFSLFSLSPLQSTDQLSSSVSVSEEVAARLSSSNPGKITNSRTLVSERRRSRSSLTRHDADESPLSLPCSEVALKPELDELHPVKIEPATVALSTDVVTSAIFLSSRVSPTKTVPTTAALDSSTELSEAGTPEQISPIARKNQTLLEHLKRPPSFPGVQPDSIDVKKLRLSPPVTDVRPPTIDAVTRRLPLVGDNKAGHPLDHSSSSTSSSTSLMSVTLNPPSSRQPLTVRIDASNTGSTKSAVAASSPAAAAAKPNVISPRFVSSVSQLKHIYVVSYVLNKSNSFVFQLS